jgi:Fe-S cluster assembly scaffold protein SufB
MSKPADGRGGLVCHPRLVIMAGEGSSAVVMQSYAGQGDYFSNGLTRCTIAADAKLTHTVSQEQSETAHHLDTISAEVRTKGVYSLSMVATGGLHARSNVQVRRLGRYLRCTMRRVVLLADHEGALDKLACVLV